MSRYPGDDCKSCLYYCSWIYCLRMGLSLKYVCTTNIFNKYFIVYSFKSKSLFIPKSIRYVGQFQLMEPNYSFDLNWVTVYKTHFSLSILVNDMIIFCESLRARSHWINRIRLLFWDWFQVFRYLLSLVISLTWHITPVSALPSRYELHPGLRGPRSVRAVLPLPLAHGRQPVSRRALSPEPGGYLLLGLHLLPLVQEKSLLEDLKI